MGIDKEADPKLTAVVADKFLYIDGGEINFLFNGVPQNLHCMDIFVTPNYLTLILLLHSRQVLLPGSLRQLFLSIRQPELPR